MLLRRPGQRLYLVLGSPWRRALALYQAGDGRLGEALWAAPAEFARGDLLLTVLDTRPRVLLCLERARESSQPDRWIYVEPEYQDFAPVISVPRSSSASTGRFLPPHALSRTSWRPGPPPDHGGDRGADGLERG